MNLKKYRLERNLSKKRLAEISGVSRTTISSLEAGRTIGYIYTIKRLCRALGVSPNDLLGWEDGNDKNDKRDVARSDDS